MSKVLCGQELLVRTSCFLKATTILWLPWSGGGKRDYVTWFSGSRTDLAHSRETANDQIRCFTLSNCIPD